MGAFTRDLELIVLAYAARSGSNYLCDCLAQIWSQQWSKFNEVEMSGNTKA